MIVTEAKDFSVTVVLSSAEVRELHKFLERQPVTDTVNLGAAYYLFRNLNKCVGKWDSYITKWAPVPIKKHWWNR